MASSIIRRCGAASSAPSGDLPPQGGAVLHSEEEHGRSIRDVQMTPFNFLRPVILEHPNCLFPVHRLAGARTDTEAVSIQREETMEKCLSLPQLRESLGKSSEQRCL